MKSSCPFHSFDVSLVDAKRIQCELRNQVEIRETVSHIDEIDLVGGVDVAFITSASVPFSVFDNDSKNRLNDLSETHNCISDGKKEVTIALACAVTLDVKRWRIFETAYATAPVFFPYIPGFLSFREGPAVLKACGELSALPERGIAIESFYLAGMVPLAKPVLPVSELGSESPDKALKGSRNVWWDDSARPVETPVYDASRLSAGNIIHGPAVVEAIDTTIIIPEGAKYSVDQYNTGIFEGK